MCSHTARDSRCGACGPVLIQALHAAAKSLTIDAKIFPCSHVGGHDLAGNVIVFHRKSNGAGMLLLLVACYKCVFNMFVPCEFTSTVSCHFHLVVSGDWYGYVTPAAVVDILVAVREDSIWSQLHRGSMVV